MILTSADGVGDKVLGDWKNKREFTVSALVNALPVLKELLIEES